MNKACAKAENFVTIEKRKKKRKKFCCLSNAIALGWIFHEWIFIPYGFVVALPNISLIYCVAGNYVEVGGRKRNTRYQQIFDGLFDFPARGCLQISLHSRRSSTGVLETSACVTTRAANICFRKLLDNWISKYKVGVGFVFRSMSSEWVNAAENSGRRVGSTSREGKAIYTLLSSRLLRWRHRVVFSAMDFLCVPLCFVKMFHVANSPVLFSLENVLSFALRKGSNFIFSVDAIRKRENIHLPLI